jgi:hypothetical protein
MVPTFVEQLDAHMAAREGHYFPRRFAVSGIVETSRSCYTLKYAVGYDRD